MTSQTRLQKSRLKIAPRDLLRHRTNRDKGQALDNGVDMPTKETTMKITIAASLIASAAAFAPAKQNARTAAPINAAAELEDLIGASVETGNKIVRITF